MGEVREARQAWLSALASRDASAATELYHPRGARLLGDLMRSDSTPATTKGQIYQYYAAFFQSRDQVKVHFHSGEVSASDCQQLGPGVMSYSGTCDMTFRQVSRGGWFG